MSRLLIFLLIYFSVYGALHLYVLIKLRRAFYLHGLSYGFLALLLLFLMLAPIQSRVLDAQGMEIASLVSAWVGFAWMGYLFVFFCLSLPIDAYQLLMAFGQRITGSDLTHIMLSRRQCVAIAGILAGGLVIYGAYEANQIRVETVTFESAKISSSKDRVRIVQLSDMHIGNMLYPGRMALVIDAIQAAQPDILVSTGDLVDSRVPNASNLAGLIRAIPAPLGKFAVTGNHEFYDNIDRAVQFTKASGFTLLRGQKVEVSKNFTVVGVDDPAGGKIQAAATEAALLAQSPGNRFTLLLKHRPIVDAGSQDQFDLQLSGHTHKGQIFPFFLFIKLRYPIYHGLHQLSSGGALYVNRGTGTWGPPMRLLAPPELTIIDIVPAR